MRVASPYCSSCRKNLRATNCRYCLACKARYMREWRPHNPLTGLAKIKHNCRNYLRIYIKRGKALKLPCMTCGCTDSKPYHADYSKPLEATWHCKLHKIKSK